MSLPIGWCSSAGPIYKSQHYADSIPPRPRRVSLSFAAAVAEFVVHVCRHSSRGVWRLRRGVVRSSSQWDATVVRSVDKPKRTECRPRA